MTHGAHHGLSPVILGLQIGLHLLFAGLLAFVVVMAILQPAPSAPVVIGVALVMGTTWLAGSLPRVRSRAPGRAPWGLAWLLLLLLEGAVLVWLSPHAAYLVFPLCFVILGVLPGPRGAIVVAVATGGVIIALGVHTGWSLGGVIGPIVGAIVSVAIAVGYRALADEAREHERLYRELELTQSRLAATEREAGAVAERERLAREIHDTVAQTLSSITLLLHAAERAAPDAPGIEHVRLARSSAGDALGDARRLVRDLAPAPLDGGSLLPALRELAERTSQASGTAITVVSSALDDAVDALPMAHQVALLRIAQGTLGNVASHADADTATLAIAIAADRVVMTVSDDGRGFEPGASGSRTTAGSFGLQSVADRVGQLDGILQVISSPGAGATIVVELPLGSSEAGRP